MTGIITSLPPPVEPPPSNTEGNPQVLGPLAYVPAVPTLPQTWTGVQTFEPNTLLLAGSVSGTTTVNAAATAFGTIVLPAGSTDFSSTGGTSQVVKQTAAGAPFTVAQLAFSDISGVATGSQLPTPTISTLGGVQAINAVAHNWISSISTAGIPILSQPAFSDISGSVSASQMPALTGDVTSTAGTVATTISANAVTNAKMATMAAWTLKANATSGSANPADITIDGLTLKASPASTDEVMIWDVSGAAIKKATVSSFAASAGVSSIASNTGAFTLSHGLTNSTNDLRIDIGTQQSYLAGCQLSAAGGVTTFSVTSGVAVDSTNADFMKLAAISKTSGSWAVGTGNGSLDTGTIAAGWYHVFVIKRTDTGVVDILTSLSPTSPTLPSPYTLFRRIGSLQSNGVAGQWTAFVQFGDEFLWVTPVGDVSVSTLGTTATLFTLSVPTGVQVNALIRSGFQNTAANTFALINSPDEAVSVANTPTGNRTHMNPSAGAVSGAIAVLNVRTNTLAQIRAVASAASSTLQVATYGWIDRRGRDT